MATYVLSGDGVWVMNSDAQPTDTRQGVPAQQAAVESVPVANAAGSSTRPGYVQQGVLNGTPTVRGVLFPAFGRLTFLARREGGVRLRLDDPQALCSVLVIRRGTAFHSVTLRDGIGSVPPPVFLSLQHSNTAVDFCGAVWVPSETDRALIGTIRQRVADLPAN
ncbi:MAG: hypothetical protein AAF938_19985 [Myxococcota bacterium]